MMLFGRIGKQEYSALASYQFTSRFNSGWVDWLSVWVTRGGRMASLGMVAIGLGLSVSAELSAWQEPPATEAASNSSAQAAQQPSPQNTAAQAAEAEQRALAFIEQQQPRLRKLMAFLKDKQPAAYQQAMREAVRIQQRLEGLAERDPELHKIELELWQTQSRLRLLAAEMAVAKPAEREALQGKLQTMIEQEAACQLRRLQLLRERAVRQLAKLDEDIAEHSERHEQWVAKTLKNWQNKIKKQAASREQ